eukprot:CAMPEP_0116025858 /NCGR_PEP_ID=MMETSP0321-20121206/13389_1 /TAXON_ID=163516 /ORGANISM="Leptocylindrus danicus var. danicus, Strain B650" /LENGTH=201 /DNA_ID=CAMNT_0003498313 /DNA_START=348 /DNA_END=953 /DNA_ORIENTATION=+
MLHESTSTRCIHWAQDLEQIVCEVDTLSPSEKAAYWYDGDELETIETNSNKLINAFKKMGQHEQLAEAEERFNAQGHSLRGLEAMQCCPMRHRAKIVQSNRCMLEYKGKDRHMAMKRSKKHAKQARQMGLYDEEHSMCYAGATLTTTTPRKSDNDVVSCPRKSVAPDDPSLSSIKGHLKKSKGRLKIMMNLKKRFSRTSIR